MRKVLAAKFQCIYSPPNTIIINIVSGQTSTSSLIMILLIADSGTLQTMNHSKITAKVQRR